MNNTLDLNDIFDDFLFPLPTHSTSNDNKSSDLMPTFTDCSPQILQDELLQESILEIPEPKEINQIWLQDQIPNQYSIPEKPLFQSRKDTADGEEICPQKLTKEQRRKKRFNQMQKNQTKNIPKNFGKAIVAFIQKHQKLVKQVIEKTKAGTVRQFMAFLEDHSKKEISTIADIRELWVEHPYQSVMRRLSSIFLRKHSLNYIFNSRVRNYVSHIKYRQRFLEAIQAPNEFKHIKDF